MEKEIAKIANELKELDEVYAKLLWDMIEPYTHNLADINKADRILWNTYLTVSVLDLRSKLRNIKINLEVSK